MDTKLDLVFAQVVAEQIDDYVHAEVLFYPVGAVKGMQMPQLTIGTWLETEWRLNAVASSAPNVAAQLEKTRAEVRRIRNRVPDMYQNKARREFKSRLDTWDMFLEEQTNPGGKPIKDRVVNDSAGYTTQVHTRVKLELLQNDVSQMAAQLSRLRMADAKLRMHFKAGSFIWEPELQPFAPQDKWWWLWAAGGTVNE